MEIIGCSKQMIWGTPIEKITYCKRCSSTYDSKCPCNGVEFIYSNRAEMEERIKKALEIAWQYGQIDGSHHRVWVIDQMVRVLCGSEKEYIAWVTNYEAPESDDPDDYYSWDTGIAP